MKKFLFGGAAVVALSIAAFGGSGCPGGEETDGGVPFTTHTLDSATFVSAGQTGGTDGCAIGDTNGTEYPLVYDSATGNLKLGTVGGSPAVASAGEGFLSNNTGTLVRDNTVTSGTCTFKRHVESAITVTGDNALTDSYTRTDTEHSAGCVDQTTDCTSTFTFNLTKKP